MDATNCPTGQQNIGQGIRSCSARTCIPIATMDFPVIARLANVFLSTCVANNSIISIGRIIAVATAFYFFSRALLLQVYTTPRMTTVTELIFGDVHANALVGNYVGLTAQTLPPPVPIASVHTYADASGLFAYERDDGFSRIFSDTNTNTRTYSFPDITDNIVTRTSVDTLLGKTITGGTGGPGNNDVSANKLRGATVSATAPASGDVLAYDGTALQWAPRSSSIASGNAIFGTANLPSSFSLGAGGTFALTGDVYYINVTIGVGATLNTNGWRLFVSGVLTNNGHIHNDGANAVGAVGGAGGGTGTIGGGTSGATATGTATGPSAVAAIRQLGGSGGHGGGGGLGVGGNGTFGLPPLSTNGGAAVLGDIGRAIAVRDLANNICNGGSAGSAGGGSAGGGLAGGGGGGGGCVMVSARIITGTGTITANGGNGGDAVNGAGDNGGGGGSGGGGVIVVLYNSLSGVTFSATRGTVGLGATNVPGGSNGFLGNPGIIMRFQN